MTYFKYSENQSNCGDFEKNFNKLKRTAKVTYNKSNKVIYIIIL